MVSQNPPKHGPNHLLRYLAIHDSVLADRIGAGDFVGEETIEIKPHSSRGRPGFLLEGEIGCRGEIVISVSKFLEILDKEPHPSNPWIETRWYNYHVFIRGWRSVLRYDNQDAEYLRPGHEDEHHKHVYDLETGQDLPCSPVCVGSHGWPVMHEVIDEARAWYWDNRTRLPNPDAFPALGVRGLGPDAQSTLR